MSKIVIDLTEVKTELTFKDVKVNEFFLDNWGQVCQKHNDTSYNSLCDVDGKNFSDRCNDVHPTESIHKILDITFKR